MNNDVPPFDVVLFHGLKTGSPCHDGFGVAYSAWLHARKHGREGILAIPLIRGEPMPADLLDQVRGKRVLMGDFAYEDVETMRKLTDACGEFVLLDHHKSAMEALSGAEWRGKGWRETVFQMDKSGALLAWEYLFPGERVPKLITYVSDRDLWTFKLPYAREVSSHMQSLECTFDMWDSLCRVMESPEGFERIVDSGTAIERYKSQLVDLIAEEPRVIDTALGKAAFVNSACLQSELGERLASTHAFACVWWAHGDFLHMSFRSAGSLDVSELARALGGGGHARAAGAQRALWNGADILDVVMVVAAGASKVAGAHA